MIHITEHYHKLWCNFFFYPYISKYITIILYLSITLGILFFSLHSEKIWQMGINSQVIYLFLGRDIVIYKGCSLLFSFSTKSKRKNFITSTSLFFGRSRTNYCYIFFKISFYEKSFFHWRTESKFSEFNIYKHQNLDTIL